MEKIVLKEGGVVLNADKERYTSFDKIRQEAHSILTNIHTKIYTLVRDDHEQLEEKKEQINYLVHNPRSLFYYELFLKEISKGGSFDIDEPIKCEKEFTHQFHRLNLDLLPSDLDTYSELRDKAIELVSRYTSRLVKILDTHNEQPAISINRFLREAITERLGSLDVSLINSEQKMEEIAKEAIERALKDEEFKALAEELGTDVVDTIFQLKGIPFAGNFLKISKAMVKMYLNRTRP